MKVISICFLSSVYRIGYHHKNNQIFILLRLENLYRIFIYLQLSTTSNFSRYNICVQKIYNIPWNLSSLWNQVIFFCLLIFFKFKLFFCYLVILINFRGHSTKFGPFFLCSRATIIVIYTLLQYINFHFQISSIPCPINTECFQCFKRSLLNLQIFLHNFKFFLMI